MSSTCVEVITVFLSSSENVKVFTVKEWLYYLVNDDESYISILFDDDTNVQQIRWDETDDEKNESINHILNFIDPNISNEEISE